MNRVLAQIRNPVLPPGLGGGPNPSANSGGTALGQLISNLVGALFIAGFLLAFLNIIMGGLNWITAGGDKQKLETSRDKITNSITGLLVVAATYALTSLIARFFGLDLTALSFPTIGQ